MNRTARRICGSLVRIGLVAGGTLSRGSALKGAAMTVLGLLVGLVGTDVNSGVTRLTFGFADLAGRVEIVAPALALFGVAEFLLNVPLIGVWVRLLRIPYRYLYPSALFFMAVGVYSTNTSLFEVGEVLVFGVAGAGLIKLRFPMSPILLGYVLGPMVEDNFRRATLLSHGDLSIFVTQPISAVVLGVCALVVAGKVYFWARGFRTARRCRQTDGIAFVLDGSKKGR